ncbi:MAG: ABC transporter ATP-binding protein [Zoogloeaceae bacterium]|jgi:iron complex transport system ATP-binding protein|nr:ABC transporter ATP-binding protein [Zoogloeaceae bacterium]
MNKQGMPDARPLLEAHELTVAIGGRSICRMLTLAVAPGEILVILGRNGVGKSTLLATLAGLRAPASGEIRLAGQGYAQHGAKLAARLRGWLGQRQEDPFSASALEIALMGRHPHLARWQWEGEAELRLARAALAEVGLAGCEAQKIESLSGGERQRLAIAALLVQEAPLMLLDEPLTHLDLNHQIAVLELLAQRARAGAALILVLHDPGLARRYAQRVLLLYGEGESALGESETILTPETLSRLYGYPLLQAETAGRIAFIPA